MSFVALALAAALSVDVSPTAQARANPESAVAQRKSLFTQQPQLDCRDGNAAMVIAVKAFEAAKAHDLQTAKTNAELIIANCGAAPVTIHMRWLRAQIAWTEKDYRGVLTWLDSLPRGVVNPLSVNVGLLAMRADEAASDLAAAADERGHLLAAVDSSLSRPPGARIDSFDVDGAKVTAYSAVLNQGSFRRVLEFLVAPQNAGDLPQSLMLTDDKTADEIGLMHPGQPTPYFLDFYTCSMHATVKILQAVNGGPPTYETVKPLVIAFLQKGGGATSSAPNSQAACAWPQYVAPITGN